MARARRGPGRGRIVRVNDGEGAVYIGDWTDASGKRHRKRLSSDKRVSERMLAEIIRTRDLQHAGLGAEEGVQLDPLALRDQYLADLETRCSAAYHRRSSECLERLLSDLGAPTLQAIKLEAVINYRQRRTRAGAANRTANMEVAVLKTMLNWAVAAGLLASNPIARVRMLPQGKAHQKLKRRALTESEAANLIRASRTLDQELGEHQLAVKTITSGVRGEGYASQVRMPRIPQTPFWLALIETGARFGEMALLTWDDFDEARGVFTFRAETTKGRKERSVPVSAALVNELKQLRIIHHALRGHIVAASEPVFLSPRGSSLVKCREAALRLLRATLQAANVPKIDSLGRSIDIHALRHTCASRLARSGVSLQHAQRLLGHSDPKLTAAIYTHLDVEDIRDALKEVASLIDVADGHSGPTLPVTQRNAN